MSAAAKLAGFLIALVAVFGVATVAGGAIDPDRGSSSEPAHGAADADANGGDHGADAAADETSDAVHGADSAGGGAVAADAGAHGDDGADADATGAEAGGHADHGASADAVRGLAVAQDGLRLDVVTPELAAGRPGRLAFRILGADGRAVRDFDLEHERRMHVIVARRDLSGFQHLHPRIAADGTWSVPLTIDAAGSYRVFADFATGGEPFTLASDLRVDGDADLTPLPAPATDARSDGGDAVTLSATGRPLRAGREQTLRFAIERDGTPVELQRYLGAGGHLVALREGDLAFLHVHPTGPAPAVGAGGNGKASEPDHTHAPGEEHGDSGASDGAGDSGASDGAGRSRPSSRADAASRGEVEFATTFPTPGRYRLFLQYRVDGRVETVAFTVEVAR